MEFRILEALRERLSGNAGIREYLALHYPGTPVHWLIGAKLRPAAHEFPYIAMAPIHEAAEPRPSRERTLHVSVQFGVNDPEVVGGVSLGLTAICELSELIMAAVGTAHAISSAPTAIWTGEARIASDAGTRHPFYEGELILTIKTRA